jgi:hypothetical protein
LRKFAVILFLCGSLWGAKAHAQAANIYIAQTGATSGVCTSSVQTPSFFNNAANCGTGGAQIGSDTVVHLCGTFSSTDHLNPLLVFQGGGPAGHPITLLFETGADLTNTYWGLHGASAITTAGASHIVIDGNNVGIIEDTQNGTGLANHAGSSAVYVTIACSTSSVNDNGIFFTNCQNYTAQHNTISDTFAGIVDSGGASSSGAHLYPKHHFQGELRDYYWCQWERERLVQPIVDFNHITDAVNWDGTGGHHNCVFLFTE